VDWKEEYKRKLVSAEEAVKIVKSGDRVALGGSTEEPQALTEALFARRDELKGVKIIDLCPMRDYAWSYVGYEESFEVELMCFAGPIARDRVNDRTTTFIPNTLVLTQKADERAGEGKVIDVDMVTVSPPDKQGFCCFGPELWWKKDWLAKARKVIAEVNSNMRWVCGPDTTIHVSEIDCFVEHTPAAISDEELPQRVAHIEDEVKRQKMIEYGLLILPEGRPRALELFEFFSVEQIDSLAQVMGWVPPRESREFEAIAGYVNLLVNSRDTVQIGIGLPSMFLPHFGCFADKEDLGYHGEIQARGVIMLVKEEQITGKYKTLHPNRYICNSFVGASPEEVDYATENSKFELHSACYTTDPRVVAMNDNMVTINNALSVDLTGQMNSETIFGSLLANGPGGLPELHLGALLSKGGRAITAMRSTVMGGTVSTIVPQFEPGTVVTVPRHYADYIVTEHGIAKLMNKNFRERAQELISVAHPDHRAELKREAKRLFWP